MTSIWKVNAACFASLIWYNPSSKCARCTPLYFLSWKHQLILVTTEELGIIWPRHLRRDGHIKDSQQSFSTVVLLINCFPTSHFLFIIRKTTIWLYLLVSRLPEEVKIGCSVEADQRVAVITRWQPLNWYMEWPEMTGVDPSKWH